MSHLYAFLLATIGLLATACSQAPDEGKSARIAVATNFKPVMSALQEAFEAQTEFEIEVITGSTGMLYTQIINSAPFDVFLSADAVRPEKLEENGQVVAGTRLTYAIGKLVFWHPGSQTASMDHLVPSDGRKLAIANPGLAPYGRAAEDVLRAMELRSKLGDSLVMGENVGQAFTFIKTGNAAYGLVALSQVLSLPEAEQGAYWLPPQAMYTPIRQDGVLLTRAADNEAATAFLAFLASAEARQIIVMSGYDAP